MIAAPADGFAANCLAYLTADAAFKKAAAPYLQAKRDAEAKFKDAVSNSRKKFRKAINRAKMYARKFSTPPHITKLYRKQIKEAYSIYVKAMPSKSKRSYFLRMNGDIGVRLVNPLQKFSPAEQAAEQAMWAAYKAAKKYFKNARERAKAKRKSEAREAVREAVRIANEDHNKELDIAMVARKSALKKHRISYDEAQRVLRDAYAKAYENPGPYSRKVSRYDKAIVGKLARHERSKFCPR